MPDLQQDDHPDVSHDLEVPCHVDNQDDYGNQVQKEGALELEDYDLFEVGYLSPIFRPDADQVDEGLSAVEKGSQKLNVVDCRRFVEGLED